MTSDSRRDALVRRNTLLLMGAQASFLAASTIWFSVAVVAIADLTGRERWAGIFLAMFNSCVAASALLVGRHMDRAGRRPGLVLAYVLVGSGGGLGAAAMATESAWLLFVAGAVFGAGMGAALLGRVAAADMYTSERRGRVVGILLAAGTVGAVLGTPLVAVVEQVSGSEVIPFAMIPCFAALGLAAALALRPDPKDLAVEDDDAPKEAAPARPLRELLRLAPLRAAILSIVVAQTAMVAVMGVTPVAIDDRGGGALAIALVLSFHVAGMYALGPVIGSLLDRLGRRPGLVAGAVLSAAGALLGSFPEQIGLVAFGLFLVGLGWAGCYLGATAVVSDLTSARERGSALGLTDLCTSLAAAAGVLASGFVLESSGLAPVGVAMAALMLPVLLVVLPLREPAPGHWGPPPRAVAEEAS